MISSYEKSTKIKSYYCFSLICDCFIMWVFFFFFKEVLIQTNPLDMKAYNNLKK